MANNESASISPRITTLIDATSKAAQTMLTFGNELGITGQRLRFLAADMKALTWILHSLHTRFTSAESILCVGGVLLAEEVISLCQSDIRQIQERLLVFGTFGGSGRNLREWTRWAFGKFKISTARQTVRSLDLMLTLLAHTLELNRVEGEIWDSVREEIHCQLANPTNIKIAFLHAEQQDLKKQSSTEYDDPPANGDLLSSASKDGTMAMETLALVATHDFNMNENSNQSQGYMGTGHATNSVSRISEIESDSIDSEAENAPDYNLSGISSMTDEHFLWIATHVRLHKAVFQYATGALAVPPEYSDYTPSAKYVPSDRIISLSPKHFPPAKRSVELLKENSQAFMEPGIEHLDDDVEPPSSKEKEEKTNSGTGIVEIFRRGTARQEREVLYDPEPAMPPKKRSGRRNRNFVEYWSDYDVTDSDQSEEEGAAKRLVRRMFSRV